MPTRADARSRSRTPSAGTGPAGGVIGRGITAADLALRHDLQRHLRRLRAEHRRLLRALHELHRLEASSTELASLAELPPHHGLGARRVLPS
jgi:hypothetical protein